MNPSQSEINKNLKKLKKSGRVFTQTFGVTGGLIERDGKFLLVQESERVGPDVGKWNHPAGWIDIGESPVQAAMREVKEETGFDFTPTHLLGVYSLVRTDLKKDYGITVQPIKLIFIGTTGEKASPQLETDVARADWFTPEEILNMQPTQLRDLDIKNMVKDYLAGKRYPLEVVSHLRA